MRQGGIGLTALDNALGSASDPAAVQRICDGLTDQKIYRFAGRGRPGCRTRSPASEVGYAANRRLLDAECISHDPADGAAALEAITSPVISTTCTRVPGTRFPDPRVQLLGARRALALRPARFTSQTCGTTSPPSSGKRQRT